MTPLFKKLNFKEHVSILVMNAPESFKPELEQMSNICDVVQNVHEVQKTGFSVVFVTQEMQIREAIELIYPKLEGDAILWFAYPKASSKKYSCDFNRDKGWSALGKYDLEPVRQVAIDEDWSALRFRKVEFIKTFTRRSGFALSEKGKEKLKAKNS